MDHQERSLAIMEWLATKPGDQFTAVFRFQDVVNRIPRSYRGDVFCYSKQEEIVIAQYHLDGIAETSHEPEEGERFRASIDEVSGQPQSICLWIERNPIEEPSEWIEATLNVADCVYSHEWRAPVTG